LAKRVLNRNIVRPTSMPERNFQIQRASLSDAKGIARVHVRSWQSAYRGQIPDDVLDSLDESKRAARWFELIPQPGHVVHIAVHDGIVIGFCSLIRSRDPDGADDAGEIAAIYVDPEHWRSGVGSALLDASLDVARSTGYREVTLWVLASNALGRRFYERLGFAPDGKAKVEEQGRYSLHEIRYKRQLTP
jgi:GNAT superfamily N-acetyltransferase